MSQIGAKIDEEQALVIQLQKRIKELQVNIYLAEYLMTEHLPLCGIRVCGIQIFIKICYFFQSQTFTFIQDANYY